MSKPLEALPGKAILLFPSTTETVRGGIIIPERSRRRVEFAKLVDIGAATTGEEEIRRRDVLEASNRGRLFAISVISGTPLYQLELDQEGNEKTDNLGEAAWLQGVRVYAISQLHTTVADPGNLSFPRLER